MMRNEYKKEISDLKIKMEKAESFAKKIPIFADKILSDKIQGDEVYVEFGSDYKSLNLGWGINRGLFISGTNRSITNFDGGDYKEYLFSIYINTLSLYNSHVKFGLERIPEKVDVFFYDECNSTFYVEDHQIEPLLESLVKWYEAAKKKSVKSVKREEIKILKEKLVKLESQ